MSNPTDSAIVTWISQNIGEILGVILAIVAGIRYLEHRMDSKIKGEISIAVKGLKAEINDDIGEVREKFEVVQTNLSWIMKSLDRISNNNNKAH